MDAFVWDQSGIRIIGIMRVSVCLGAIRIPEYLAFHSSYSAPRSRIAGIYSGIYSWIYFYSGISQTNAPYVSILLVWKVDLSTLWGVISLHSIARFLFYHMDIFKWHSLKRHRNFQGISKFGSSRKTRISKLPLCIVVFTRNLSFGDSQENRSDLFSTSRGNTSIY